MLLAPPKPQSDPTDNDNIVAYSDGCVMEVVDRRSEADEQSRRNYNLYLGRHFTDLAPNESERLVFNRIKTAVIAHAAVQNGTRPKITHTARESGEPPVCYLNTKVQVPPSAPGQPSPLMQLLASIRPECLRPVQQQDGTWVPPQPLNDEEAERVRQAIAQSEMATEQAAAANAPAPAGIPSEILVEINDHSAAEALQEVFDGMWEECNADFFCIENSLYNGIFGWSNMLYQFDDEEKKHVLFNCEYPQVFIDVTRTDISTAQYAIFDYIISAEQGAGQYPKIASIIEEQSQEGRVVPAGAYNYQSAGVYSDTHFRRNMVTLRTMWVRNQRYPMSAEEALAKGLIIAEQVPADSPSFISRVVGAVKSGVRKLFRMGGDTTPTIPDQSDDDAGKGDLDEAGETIDADSDPVSGGDSTVPGEADSAAPDTGETEHRAGGGDDPNDGGDSGGVGGEGLSHDDPLPSPHDDAGNPGGGTGATPVAGGTPGSPQTREAYYLVDPQTKQPTSQEVKPWGPGWPMRPGIRQIRIIAGQVVDDRECEFVDIPLPHNVNFPVPHRPWGQGTPEDLESLNIAIDKVLTDLVEHHDQNTFATQIIPESVNAKRPQFARDKYMSAGEALIVSDDIIKATGGKLAINLAPPPMPTDAWKFLQSLLDLMDKQAEMAQVLQGQVPAGTSGEAFGQMQSAAQTSILFRSKRTEQMIKHLVKLMDGCILYRMEPEDLAARCRKYPVHVWYALHSWMVNHLVSDVGVEISTGAGASKNQQTGQLLQAQQQGAQISQQTILERLNLDPDVELSQSATWARKMAQQGPPPMAQSPVSK